MYWYWVKTSHDKYNGGSCGGGITVLVLCIGIAPRLQMKYTFVVVPLYWYYVLVLSPDFTWQIQWGGCGGGTTVLVLCIGIESTLPMINSVVVVVPLYWYYVLVLSPYFTWLIYKCGGCGGGTNVLVFRPDFTWQIQMWWLWWWYHCIGIMYWYWVQTSHDMYNSGGCGGATFVKLWGWC